MPPVNAHIDFSIAWVGFTQSYGSSWRYVLLPPGYPARKARHDVAAPFVTLVPEAVAVLQDVGLGAEIQKAWLTAIEDPQMEAPARLYLGELRAFAAAAETARWPEEHEELIGHGDTILDSADKMFPDLPPWVKTSIHGVREIGSLAKALFRQRVRRGRSTGKKIG